MAPERRQPRVAGRGPGCGQRDAQQDGGLDSVLPTTLSLIPVDDTLAQIEPLYFLDYAIFTGAVRHYASGTLEEAFKADPNPLRRRLHFVNLVKEEYAAYEDAGAMLKALLDYRAGKVAIPLQTLIDFKARDVHLAEVFGAYGVDSGEALWRALRLEDWIPDRWQEWFPDLNLEKALRLACSFFVEDCVQNQKRHGIVAYNKIKHGLLVTPSARQYQSNLPDAPGAIFPSLPADREASGKPYGILAFDPSDEQIENRHAAIEFVQCGLRLFAGLYVVWRYPDALERRGLANPRRLFACQEFTDVRHLIEEVTKKK